MPCYIGDLKRDPNLENYPYGLAGAPGSLYRNSVSGAVKVRTRKELPKSLLLWFRVSSFGFKG